MTTTFPTDNRTIVDQVDATTGWTSTDGPTLFTSAPTPIEASGCLALQASNSIEDAYFTQTSDDFSGGGTLSIWMQDRAEFETFDNVGIGIQLGDGTNRVAYKVGGSDGTAFRHDTGPVKWACFLLDPGSLPGGTRRQLAGLGAPTLTAITQVGVYFETIVKSVGGADNCFWDIVRWANPGDDVVMQGGATSGAAGNAEEAAAVDRSTATLGAYGVIRELGAGVYGIQGNLTVGNSASSADQYWTEVNVTYAWEDRGLSANNYYRFVIIGSSTATNCEASFTACTFVVPTAASASFDGDGADLTVCTITGCTFIGFDQGITTSSATADDWTANTYIGCDTVVASGCDMSGSSFSESVCAANTSVLSWNVNADPDGKLDDLTIAKTSGTAHHAIEFGTSTPTTSMTLRGCAFGTDFSATQGGTTGDETFHFLDTTGTITLNLIGCTGNKGYRTEGVVVTIVDDPVTVLVNVKDNTGANLQDARVTLRASDGTGPFPYQEAITATNTTTTANVTHTGHGMATGDKVTVYGANETEYNGVFTITVTGVNAYTYTMLADPGGSATGSPTATFTAVNGVTDASGNISASRVYASAQPLEGVSRKSTSSPLFKTFDLAGTVSSSLGLTINIRMQLDE